MGNQMAIISWPTTPADAHIKSDLIYLASLYHLEESEQPLGTETGKTLFAVDISGLGVLVKKDKVLSDFINGATSMIWRNYNLHAKGKRENLPV